MKTLIALAIIGLALIVIGPIAIIWALNILFPVLAINLSLSTWFAVLILQSLLLPGIVAKSK